MNYKEIRDRSLQLLNQYSIAGKEIPEDYNNQKDYIDRIPALVNDAMVYIATTAKRILSTHFIDLSEADEVGGMYEITVPSDCYQISPSGIIRIEDGKAERWAQFKRVGNSLFIPKHLGGDFMLEYYRYPQRLENPPDDEDELDGRVDAQSAIPYYVAAHLVLYDDPTTRHALMDEFEARLSRLSEEQYVEISGVEDAYGWGDCSGY